jgi:hypothetical protein
MRRTFIFLIPVTVACLRIAGVHGGSAGFRVQANRGQQAAPAGAVTLNGTVVVDGDLPRPMFQFRLINGLGQEFSPVTNRSQGGSTPVSAFDPANLRGNVGRISYSPSPNFTMQLPPGEYRTNVSGLPPGYTLQSVTAGAADLLAETLKVTATGSAPITIKLTPAPQPPRMRVIGRVLNATSRPGAGNARAPIPPNPVRSVALINAAFTEPFIAAVDANGRFEFPSVLPGAYQLHALPQNTPQVAATVVVSDKDVTQLEITAPPINCVGC